MLVLTRNEGEKIIIGDNIELIIVRIQGDSVRIGVTAPSHISVHREEIYKQIEAEKKRQK